jgi:PEP-CTERM motif
MKLAVAMIVVLATFGVAKANTLDFSYTNTSGTLGTTYGSGEVVTDDLSPANILSVTGASAYNGGALESITGKSAYALADNQIAFPNVPAFSFAGFSWSTADDQYNLFWNAGDGAYEVLQYTTNNAGFAPGIAVELQIAAVPEPSTWAMMLLGFIGVGFVAYRRNQGQAFAMRA